MENVEKIALASLLHDMGKFYQRAKSEKWNKDRYKNEFKYEHAYFSYKWIIEHKKLLSESFQDLDIEKLANLASKHHNPTNSLEIVIQLADWYSSAHEREKKLEDKVNYLHCVFERVSFKEEKSEKFKNFAYYKLNPLSLKKENIFPEVFEGFFEKNEVKNIENIKIKLGNYEELYENFENDLKNIKNFHNKNAFLFLYYLIQKYLWCVPASTFDIEKGSRHYPDISLFDHSKVLGAIASVIYKYTDLEKDKLNEKYLDNENFLLLVEGDITGIQKFIFNIGKTQDIGDFSISKALRGRSFIVSMIPEIIARYILDKLDYTILNALYIGGGKFQLLVDNKDETIQTLNEIEKEINKYFFDNFHSELGLVLACKNFNGKTLKSNDCLNNNLASVIEETQIILDEKKKRKFFNHLAEDFKEKENLCLSCKSLPVEDNNLCWLCNKSNEIGGKLPKVKYISFTKNQVDNEGTFNLGKFGGVILLNEPKDRYDEVLILNSTEFNKNNGFKFIGNTVPLFTDDILNYEDETIQKAIEDFKKSIPEKDSKGIAIPFKILGEFSKGDKKLGVFRADVDNLGLIFSDALKAKSREDTDRYTISRIVNLSRMLDLFFTGYINTLAKEEKFLEKGTSLIYIVYSGGDDIFIIAPWDKAIEFAMDLRKNFYEFTAKNLTFGLSGGIYITNPDTPISHMAHFAEKLENKSKKAFYFTENKQLVLKDSISILEKTYLWEDFDGISSLSNIIKVGIEEELKKKGLQKNEETIENELKKLGFEEELDYITFKQIYKIVEKLLDYKEHLSKSFLYKLIQLHQLYVKKEKSEVIVKANIYPKIYYQIARNFKGSDKRDVRNLLEKMLLKDGYENLSKEQIIRNLDVILFLYLMLTRGGE